MVSMEIWQYIITIVTAVMASSGFWAIIQKRMDRKDDKTKLLLGICHDRIFYLGMLYIERGYVTRDELTNIQKYLSGPYFKLGGNGAVKRVMEDVEKLPIRHMKDLVYKEVKQ